jgi:hypothetical protein
VVVVGLGCGDNMRLNRRKIIIRRVVFRRVVDRFLWYEVM